MLAAARALPLLDEWGSPIRLARVSCGAARIWKERTTGMLPLPESSGYLIVNHQIVGVSGWFDTAETCIPDARNVAKWLFIGRCL
jgi:hypothetical protein